MSDPPCDDAVGRLKTFHPSAVVRAAFSKLRQLLEGFIDWVQLHSFVKLAALISQISILAGAATYIADEPKREEAAISAALGAIKEAIGQPHNNARYRALKFLNANCVSAAGLNLESAELSQIDLRPCAILDPKLAWPPRLATSHPFDLSHARMTGVVLRGAHLDYADMRHTDLRNADLRGASLDGTRLDGADLSNANLASANLRQAELVDARLVGAQMDHADLTGANLTGADLNAASLVRGDLANANLTRAIVIGATLSGAGLCGAQLYKTNLVATRMDNANLDSAMLVGVNRDPAAIGRGSVHEQGGGFRVGMVAIDMDDEFFRGVKLGIERELEDPTVKAIDHRYDNTCSSRSALPAVLAGVVETHLQFEEGKRAIEKLINKKVDAIILRTLDDDRLADILKQAYDSGIVLVCYDSCRSIASLRHYFSGEFESDQYAIGRLAAEYLAAHLDSARRDMPLRIGVLHCGILADNCNDRYFGFAAALNSAGLHWRLSGILEGWNETNAPSAAAKLLADDPAIDVLWAENGAGTKALALAAASLPRPIMVLGTDRSPRLEQLLHQPARNPLLAFVAQSPEIMGRCAAAAALAALGRQGSQVLPQNCLGPTPVSLYSHDR